MSLVAREAAQRATPRTGVDGGVSAGRVAWLLAAASLTTSCHVGVGPVVGYTFRRGASFGWEASGGWAVARGSVGGSYRTLADYRPEGDTDAAATSRHRRSTGAPVPAPDPLAGRSIQPVHYAAFEPGFLLGATVGAGVAERSGPSNERWGGVYGGWLGAPLPIELASENGGPDPLLSVALGVRWLVDATEFYVTPKINVVQFPRIAH